MLAHALDLLLGGKPRRGSCGPERRRHMSRASSSCPPGCSTSRSWRTCATASPDDVDEIVLGRRVGAEGRTRAFVQGRSASAGDLRALGGRLVAFYGQHEHRRLTVASAQLELLDAFCGREQLDVRAVAGHRHARMRSLERASRSCASGPARAIATSTCSRSSSPRSTPRPDRGGEETCLAAERSRLQQIDGLLAAAGGGAESLAPTGEEPASRRCSPTPSGSRRRSPARIPN